MSSVAAENVEVNGRVDEGIPPSVYGLRHENYDLYYTVRSTVY